MEPKNTFPFDANVDHTKQEKIIGINQLGSFELSPVATKRRKISRRQLKKFDQKIFNNNYKTARGLDSYECNYDNNFIENQGNDSNKFVCEDSAEVKKDHHSEIGNNQELEDEDNNFNPIQKKERIQSFIFPSRTPSPDNVSSSSSQNLHIDVTDNEECCTADALSNYQDWVFKTYGDQTKTKTVTEKKYERIVRTLKGEIPQCAENSKFRFWIRSKGFRIVPASDGKSEELYVSTIKGYKKVAVVEKFLDIIRNVHIGRGRRGNRHAGQKRTYRAITESYSFLPREAVTKYLLGCEECQKRSEVDCDAKKNLRKQNVNKKNTKNLKVGLAAEKKALKPKNLFIDIINKIESNCSTTKTSFTVGLEPTSNTEFPRETTNTSNTINTNDSRISKPYLTVKPINEIFSLNRHTDTQESLSLHSQKFYTESTENSNLQTKTHIPSLSSNVSHNFLQFASPHSNFDKEKDENQESPKSPINLCTKQSSNLSNQISTFSNEENPTNETPTTTNFRKRKQSSYLIFRYTTSTPETPKNLSIKKDNTSTSSSNTTISRSSDFANESCLDVSPIEKDPLVVKPIMQITTSERKINIPINVPHYNTYCNRIGENIPLSNESLRHAVHSDLVTGNRPTSPIVAGGTSINVPSVKPPRYPHLKDEEQVRYFN